MACLDIFNFSIVYESFMTYRNPARWGRFLSNLVPMLEQKKKKKKKKKNDEKGYFLYAFRWITEYRDFSVKINGENNSEITIFIFTVCKNRSFYEFSARSLAQKV